MLVWRIVRKKWGRSAFDGEGAARTGNRWNSKGVRMVYGSPTLSLAALEVLVHADPSELAGPFVAVSAEVPESLAASAFTPEDLPADWRSYPAPTALQRMGDAWIQKGATAVLYVPSAVIPRENNVLLNPLHPDFAKLAVLAPEPFEFDPRLGSR
jgi:RES domain-containing protein